MDPPAQRNLWYGYPEALRYCWCAFPPPWSVDERPACFIISDANGQALA
jgi:hypothetical protein